MATKQRESLKPTLDLYVELEPVSDNRLGYHLEYMLRCLNVNHVPGSNTIRVFLQLLDAANLLDVAMETSEWANLPYEVNIVVMSEPVLRHGSC